MIGITAGFGNLIGSAVLNKIRSYGFQFVRIGDFKADANKLRLLANEVVRAGLKPVMLVSVAQVSMVPDSVKDIELYDADHNAEPLFFTSSQAYREAVNAVAPLVKAKSLNAYVGALGLTAASDLAKWADLLNGLDDIYGVSIHHYGGAPDISQLKPLIGKRSFAVFEFGYDQGQQAKWWQKFFGIHTHLTDQQQGDSIVGAFKYFDLVGSKLTCLYQLNDAPPTCPQHPQYALKDGWGVRTSDFKWKPSADAIKAAYPPSSIAPLTYPQRLLFFQKRSTRSITVPTREQVCRVQTSGMQGLYVQTQQFGKLPWWDAALPWLTQADRMAVYAAKRAAENTHQLIALPSGFPLYNEQNQAYSPDKFGALDWTANNTKIDPQLPALIQEVRQNGFIPVLFLNGDDGENGYQVAIKQLPLVVDALGDWMKHTLIVPGWDGVFYGYTPDHVVAFGQLFRKLVPNGYLGIEMSEGHIPLGEGPSDWTPTGRMQYYDTLLVEFNDSNIHQDSTWQIAGRLLGPAYVRPADEPAGDDPRPPMYLSGSPRGPYFPIAFEYRTYPFVRWQDVSYVVNDRGYLKAMGWPNVG